MHGLATDKRARLSLLWVFVLLNMVYADILSFTMADTLRQILEGRAGSIDITPAFLLLAAALTEVPIVMVVLTLVLPLRAARWANLVAALFTIVYITGMGSAAPHYVFIAGVEIVGCLLIAWQAWQWRAPAPHLQAKAMLAE
jgi:hypothetical protein